MTTDQQKDRLEQIRRLKTLIEMNQTALDHMKNALATLEEQLRSDTELQVQTRPDFFLAV